MKLPEPEERFSVGGFHQGAGRVVEEESLISIRSRIGPLQHETVVLPSPIVRSSPRFPSPEASRIRGICNVVVVQTDNIHTAMEPTVHRPATRRQGMDYRGAEWVGHEYQIC